MFPLARTSYGTRKAVLPLSFSYTSAKNDIHSQWPNKMFRKTLCRIPRHTGVFFQRRPKYSQQVLDHYRSPRNAGKFQDEKAKDVGVAMVGAPSCGDVLKFSIRVGEDGKVQDAKFLTFGCGSAIASSSYATELAKGRSVEDCKKISNRDIASHLALPPIKKHCSLLAEEALKKAVEDYRNKN